MSDSLEKIEQVHFEDLVDLPPTHPDFGVELAQWKLLYRLFPNTMDIDEYGQIQVGDPHPIQ